MGQSFQLFQRNCVLDAKRPHTQSPERRDMSDRAERGSEVARDGPDIHALAGFRRELRAVVIQAAFEPQVHDFDRTGRQVGRFVGPGQIVGPFPTYLDGGILRRDLHDLPGKRGQGAPNGVVVRPCGADLHNLSVGVVFQNPVLYAWRSVRRNVELPLEVMGVGRNERRRRSGEMLELVALQDFARKSPWQLSGGMQQRVSIARALSFNPDILLMDEPFGALDEITRERMNAELQRIWETTHTTILFITHSIPEAVFLSNRVLVMSPRPGRIVLDRRIDLSHPRNEQTREDDRFFHLINEIRAGLRE